MGTAEARKALPKLARAAARKRKPSADLLDSAVAIQPRGEAGSALLLPQVDVQAARRQIENLEEELEDVAIMRMLEARVAGSAGKTTPVDSFIRELGFQDLLEEESPGG